MLIIRFLKNQRGNVLPIFALTGVIIAGFVGAAVDYSRGNSLKAAMQTALDATGLMLSRDAEKLDPGRSSSRRRPTISRRSSLARRPRTSR